MADTSVVNSDGRHHQAEPDLPHDFNVVERILRMEAFVGLKFIMLILFQTILARGGDFSKTDWSERLLMCI